jgi:hypothetical protein
MCGAPCCGRRALPRHSPRRSRAGTAPPRTSGPRRARFSSFRDRRSFSSRLAAEAARCRCRACTSVRAPCPCRCNAGTVLRRPSLMVRPAAWHLPIAAALGPPQGFVRCIVRTRDGGRSWDRTSDPTMSRIAYSLGTCVFKRLAAVQCGCERVQSNNKRDLHPSCTQATPRRGRPWRARRGIDPPDGVSCRRAATAPASTPITASLYATASRCRRWHLRRLARPSRGARRWPPLCGSRSASRWQGGMLG